MGIDLTNVDLTNVDLASLQDILTPRLTKYIPYD